MTLENPLYDRFSVLTPQCSLTFDKYKPILVRRIYGGVQVQFKFDNGWGASVISHKGSYGNEGTWELAVLRNGKLNYSTEITSDVIGNLSEPEVHKLLERIANL